MKFLRGFAVCAVLAAPLAVSCESYEYDDSEIKEQLDEVINKLYALESSMNAEIQALKSLLSGNKLIKSTVTDANTGVTTVTLSDGTVLTLQPKADMESFVTYITSDGVDYWAYIDENGVPQFFRDENNMAFPVDAEIPEVLVKDGETYIKIGNKEYPLGGNSIFSDYELITDEEGTVYAVTFIFGENMSFTVTVEGACGLMFVKNEGMMKNPVSDLYVAYGETNRVEYQANGVQNFIVELPSGWKYRKVSEPLAGENYFDITAPAAEHVESGLAEEGGVMKVMAVLEGGKAAVVELELSSNPFSEFGFNLGNVNIKMRNGLYKYVYGVSYASDFNAEAAFEQAKVSAPKNGDDVWIEDITDMPLANLLGANLQPGDEYVLWAVPVLYDYLASEDESVYYVNEGTLVYSKFRYSTMLFEIGDVAIRDAYFTLKLQGVDSYYFKLMPKDDFVIEDEVAYLNAGSYTAKQSPKEYEGSIFSFADVKSTAATEYVAWLVVAEEGKKYTEEDFVIHEFSTRNLEAGSTIAVELSEEVVTPFDVRTTLVSQNAESIYYVFLSEVQASAYTTEEQRVSCLFEHRNAKFVNTSSVSIKASDFINKDITPNTKLILMALASDSEGKYGPVLYKTYQTPTIEFRTDVKVDVAVKTNTPDLVELTVAAKGGEPVEYLYWIGETSSNTWNSDYYLGGKKEIAQVYMFMNPTLSTFADIAKKYPIVDGKISITGHTKGVGHVIVIMAKTADGTYSEATVLKFTPYEFDLGDLVLKDNPKWADANPTIEWLPDFFRRATGMMTGSYSFNLTVPLNYTAYVLCGTEAFFASNGKYSDLSVEEIIFKLVKMVDKPRDSDCTDEENAAYRFEHGDPRNGNVVMWANMDVHDAACDCGGNYDSYFETNESKKMYHRITMNDGKPLQVTNPGAIASTVNEVDKVFVMCVDLEGNCYEPFEMFVPKELFKNAPSDL